MYNPIKIVATLGVYCEILGNRGVKIRKERVETTVLCARCGFQRGDLVSTSQVGDGVNHVYNNLYKIGISEEIRHSPLGFFCHIPSSNAPATADNRGIY